MNIAIILAGGKGTRMGSVDTPKQFIDMYGKPILVHTLETFDIHSDIDAIAIVSLKEWHEDIKIWTRKYELNKVKWIVEAGKTRQESINNGLEVIGRECEEEDIVVIHESVRPLISNRIITENIEGAMEYGAVDTVIPTADTIIRSYDDETIADVPVRKELYLGQTPQSFKYSVVVKAHENAKQNQIDDATDDCQLVLKTGQSVHLVRGEKLNFKITTMEDLLLLKSIIKIGKLEMV
ncbi:2-C-methyl-D-erythritol 4-phosphate cytidylyltransferase [Lutibacter sp. B2]|nr:2-C-methyl-D-erythritol 4-phosphate cytidylyltransferase [Lutibacter sp. B2]